MWRIGHTTFWILSVNNWIQSVLYLFDMNILIRNINCDLKAAFLCLTKQWYAETCALLEEIFLNCLTFEDGTNGLSRNVATKLLLWLRKIPKKRRSRLHHDASLKWHVVVCYQKIDTNIDILPRYHIIYKFVDISSWIISEFLTLSSDDRS
jgi:hypothetical protein